MGVIYKILNPTGKLYIGKTYDLRKRINSHKCSSKKDGNIILHNSIAKYGWEAHKLEVIETVDDKLLNEREIFWILELKTYCYENKMGMNMTKGGDGQRSTWMHKIELRKWFSDKFSGEGNPFYGKTHTEENKKASSKRTSEYNKKNGVRIPEWGAEKGRNVIRRPIVCYDNIGNFHSVYNSVQLAADFFNFHHSQISDSIKYESWVSGKYLFKYKTEKYPLKIEVGEIKVKTEKRPIVLMSENFEIIAEYPSALEASQFWRIPKTTINRAAMYNWGVPIRTGHSFIYKDLYKIITQETA